ncbi:radical SAM protein [Thermococcus gorgonarius]|uniref:Biotin synthase n=1 Tax=Thermococcus gorgonarius TaxID=71997 RepID=A0A2Z2M6B8_THEGO|nr:radical SAM protein [Thermococcus gorgonarius]ASJ00719.1 biotin synthase [Thermococcus gorgonarius]
MVEMIRVSYGTAVAMGLRRGKTLARPTTAYLMTYWPGRCINDCSFCAQARSSKAPLEKLSRVLWPVFKLDDVVEGLQREKFARICLQTVDYPGMIGDVKEILGRFSVLSMPISISITPVDHETLEEFKSMGVDYVGVGLDAASERVFKAVKPGLSWREVWDFAERVVEVLGRGRAFVHVIVGLGETDKELVETFLRVKEIGGNVSLFAFTPIKGTKLENLSPPSLTRYRRIQLAQYLVEKGMEDAIVFDGEWIKGFDLSREDLKKIPPAVFMTRGCPGCNRPYYNERPGKEPYNYPFPPEGERFKEALKLSL